MIVWPVLEENFSAMMNAPYAAELSPKEFIHKVGSGLAAAMSLLEEPYLMIDIANRYSAIC